MKRVTSSRCSLAACLVCLSSLAGLLTPTSPAAASDPSNPYGGLRLTGDLELCDVGELDIWMTDELVFVELDGVWVWVPEEFEIVLGFDNDVVSTINFAFNEPIELSVEIDGHTATTENVDRETLQSVSNDLSTYIYTATPQSQGRTNIRAATNTKVTIQSDDTCPPPDLELPIGV